MNQEKIDRFYKAVSDIESLHKSELASSLTDYFEHRIGETDLIIWKENPGTLVRNQVIAAANDYLK
ncbi:hypothetical protein [Mucilaginibacter ginsenosidivorax]|uniref:Uncharacterized protein n=1 Tax=Mucilaginibacter ginsenosidivorax TaxID=862126 RepID=A0A5B8W783_9SPHI|nr:hypothetical protein [Mucilaginibacter ginsenosidivorax]QEC78752.1 hypothetical protein FSB76_23410 [Mucilaginibacter ginsenosidivorax]